MDKQKIFDHLDAIADLLNELPEAPATGETFSRDKPVLMASEKQKRFMRTLKIDFKEPITMADASKMISDKTGK